MEKMGRISDMDTATKNKVRQNVMNNVLDDIVRHGTQDIKNAHLSEQEEAKQLFDLKMRSEMLQGVLFDGTGLKYTGKGAEGAKSPKNRSARAAQMAEAWAEEKKKPNHLPYNKFRSQYAKEHPNK